jgi:hypothetical protein
MKLTYKRIAAYIIIANAVAVFGSMTIPEAIENVIRTNAGKVLPISEIKKKPINELKIDKKAKTSFLKTYKAFIIEYNKVYQDYKKFAGVGIFSAIRYGDIVLGTKTRLSTRVNNHPENSLYTAFALLTGAGVDYELIGDREHLQTLALSYGVTIHQIENGVWETLTRNWDEILGFVVKMIETQVSFTGADERCRFMKNVIHPYLTFLSRGYAIPTDIEGKVLQAFEKAFPSSGEKTLTLKKYVSVFKDYIQGTPMENKHDIALNNRLKPFGFRIDMNLNKCVTYELLDYRIPVNISEIGEILLKKRLGVALLGLDLGLATYSAKDMTLTFEYIIDEANDISIVLSSDSLPKSYKPAANKLWKEIGCRMTVEKANSLYRNLIRKDFHGKTRQEIINLVVRQVCTHEIKHKWDERFNSEHSWINVDLEVSAHLVEAIYGGCPIYGLFNLINRTQRFYIRNNNKTVRAKLKPLIIESWDIVQAISEQENARIIVVKRLKSIYLKYKTLRGKKLPSLSAYKKNIVDGPLKSIPELKI